MRSREVIVDSWKKLSQSDKEQITGILEELKQLETDEVSTSHLMVIENCVRTLTAFREKYTLRVIQLLKKGYELD